MKGYSARFIGEYNDESNPEFSVGEYFDGNYDALKNWINGTGNKSTAFDFSFKFELNNWAKTNDLRNITWLCKGAHQPAGLIHHPGTRRYATTFVDNHDTLRDHLKFNGNVLAANAFMLSSLGIPCVSLYHWNHHKTEIEQMIAAHKAVNNKIFLSELDQRMHETAMSILGARAELLPHAPDAGDVGSWLDGFLFSQSGTIYAGTNEIQRNIIAQRMLGMPRA